MSSNTIIDYDYCLNLAEWEEKQVIELLYCGNHHLSGWLESARKSGKLKPREAANERVEMLRVIVPTWTSGICAKRYYDDEGTAYYYDPFTVLDWAVKKGITLPKAVQDWYDLQNQARNSLLITNVTNDLTEPERTGHEKSKKLRALNQASEHFWNNNVDRDDKTTWTDTKVIESWLVKHGYSASLAERGATIIRPDWAPSGRK